jgi:demethylmenaquinone methyltransferase/2-methoxy-6-polyprenyl-1,4-benzoquinol methylase
MGVVGRPPKHEVARELFRGVASSYHWPARFYSLFQYDRWHRRLVEGLALGARDRVLDVCTGTGLVARTLVEARAAQVVGLDLSEDMLRTARQNLLGWHLNGPALVRGQAEMLPFPTGAFDVVVFTFLLRYVDDPASVLCELARAVRPGGQLASLEFFIPPNPLLRLLWDLHTGIVLRYSSRLLPAGWEAAGKFLRPSIIQLYRTTSIEALCALWREAGMRDVRYELLSFGGAVVMWGHK